jgi:hypothetical protein
MQNGKGSKPRPIKDINKFLSNYDKIDWSKKEEKNTCKIKTDSLVSNQDETKSNSTSTSTER